jgi:hypothetical protein
MAIYLISINHKIYKSFFGQKEFMMVIFFLLAAVQLTLWRHPYTQLFVDPYFKREKEK